MAHLRNLRDRLHGGDLGCAIGKLLINVGNRPGRSLRNIWDANDVVVTFKHLGDRYPTIIFDWSKLSINGVILAPEPQGRYMIARIIPETVDSFRFDPSLPQAQRLTPNWDDHILEPESQAVQPPAGRRDRRK